jgi:AI-2 transport protein TqsA
MLILERLQSMNMNSISTPVRLLVYSTFAVVLTVGMRELAPILTTILFSIFAALILTPLVRWLKRKGLSSGLSTFLVISLFALIVVILGLMVVAAAIEFGDQIPIYQMNLNGLITTLTHYFPSQYIPSKEELSANSVLRNIVSITISLMSSVINGLVNAGTSVGIILLTTAFILIDIADTPEKTDEEVENKSELQTRLSIFGKKMVKFIVIRAEVNLITAVGVTIIFLIGGINFAILWGVLIFLLSYVPYIGLVIASIPPIMLAFFKYGPLGALAIVVVIAVVDGLAENVLFPSLMGRGLRLSPAFLFISVLYWNFVLGVAGVLLSVPLTIILKIVFESFEETKWIARLMGPPGDLE